SASGPRPSSSLMWLPITSRWRSLPIAHLRLNQDGKNDSRQWSAIAGFDVVTHCSGLSNPSAADSTSDRAFGGTRRLRLSDALGGSRCDPVGDAGYPDGCFRPAAGSAPFLATARLVLPAADDSSCGSPARK